MASTPPDMFPKKRAIPNFQVCLWSVLRLKTVDKTANMGDPRCSTLKRIIQINADTAVLKVLSPM